MISGGVAGAEFLVGAAGLFEPPAPTGMVRRPPLATPLMLSLAREIYNPRPGEHAGKLPDPAELCRSAKAGSRAAWSAALAIGLQAAPADLQVTAAPGAILARTVARSYVRAC